MRAKLSEMIFDSISDGVFTVDRDCIVTSFNRAAERITGFKAEEAVGKKPKILQSSHTTPATYEAMWSTIKAGGWWRGEIINVKKSGEEWYSYLSISQIRDGDGQPIAYVGISRDITKMKQLQFELKDASLEAIFMLSVASETKDAVTGSHIQRVRHYSEALALRLGQVVPGQGLIRRNNREASESRGPGQRFGVHQKDVVIKESRQGLVPS